MTKETIKTLICTIILCGICNGCADNPYERYEIISSTKITNVLHKCTGLLVGKNETITAILLYKTPHERGDRLYEIFQGHFLIDEVKPITNILYKLNFKDKNTRYSEYAYEEGDGISKILNERIRE